MKSINILSVAQANSKLPDELLKTYLSASGIKMKKKELEDLTKLVRKLSSKNKDAPALYDTFFIGYKIPQISREFDLLRFGKNYIVNIELKQESTEEKIKEQLIRNEYYLSFLDQNTIHLTYVSKSNKLFRLDNDEELIEISFSDFARILKNQKTQDILNIDSQFNPSNYLVSPFNSTTKFLSGNYFLTNHQEHIKDIIVTQIENEETTFIKISAKAGTGKTLLTYDVAKFYHNQNSKKVLIIHCGKLNRGHEVLRDEHRWNIIPIKDYKKKDYSKYDVVIIDECQRIQTFQLEDILKEIKKNSSNCIFSLDPKQCLRGVEISRNINELLENSVSPINFTLTEKIRTNKEISYFIKGIFDKNYNNRKANFNNIEITYFCETDSALNHIQLLKSLDWKIINLTESTRDVLPYDVLTIPGEDNAHEVIGQEFDKVVVIVDKHFYYQENGMLSTKGYKKRPYYHPTKMLFQIMTRTQRKLNFIIIGNNEILSRAIKITDQY
ncbi:hypothetical protein APR41_04580 [Salegentibacter salinarum]|uniref:Uncharacterized protein n=1 Tax=Salegentibacter salinarum TaxID=447422 RepID=A0A2N0TUN4_9FLAO|nr:DNA/RNA helicase domain-containing protein [Salegentibacter salinarum]PKD18431.1 hypothetical protein APR41_04580 [Salegentibacter salinarum]SKB45755.1 Uncharacterized conserved protein [Salegentibacter salinarum]